MSQGVDWSCFFCEHGADEYILIGESNNGWCGHNWETWGNRYFAEEVAAEDAVVTPYERDGYVRTDLVKLAVKQYSRHDGENYRQSNTVSFRKISDRVEK